MIDEGRLRRYSDAVGIGAVLALLAGLALGASTMTGPAATATPGAGFGVSEADAAGSARWSEAASPTIDVIAHRRLPDARMVVSLESFAQPRRVVVSVDGRRATTVTVPGNRFRRFAIPLGPLPEGAHSVVLEARPGPQSIADALGIPDPRSVSVRVLDPVKVEEIR